MACPAQFGPGDHGCVIVQHFTTVSLALGKLVKHSKEWARSSWSLSENRDAALLKVVPVN